MYTDGKVGDVMIKKKLIEVPNAFLDPIRARRRTFADRPDDVIEILRKGTARANEVAEETLAQALSRPGLPRSAGGDDEGHFGSLSPGRW